MFDILTVLLYGNTTIYDIKETHRRLDLAAAPDKNDPAPVKFPVPVSLTTFFYTPIIDPMLFH